VASLLKTLSWKRTVPLKISAEASWASIAVAGAAKNVNKPKLILRRTVMNQKLLASILSVMLITVQSQASIKASATRTSADVFLCASGFAHNAVGWNTAEPSSPWCKDLNFGSASAAA
jgi:hypothetical protein